ncbi:tripartite tricarboxylate transporter substrate binding protein [Ottowia sp.]|uniref:Bug family tripartite tricarboxylate transporter substrate binding protein n=1 Tax=Ottowia sp. TaxID=1898956 RepID=UPI00261DDD22|nr:tripartite tricarboxylate transporter substrate binding protein [Ottowia sp.]
MKRAVIRLFLAIAVLGLSTYSAQAADYPGGKPIRIVVPTGAGSSTDVLARELSLRLAEKLHNSVIVDNRTGAGGSIGAQAVATAPADGYTFLMGTIGVLAINEHLYSKIPYNVERQFVPVIEVARVPNLLLVNPSLPVKTLPEFVAYAKSHAGELNFGSSGNGTSPHLAGEMLKSRAGITATHVPYRGGPEAMSDLMSGNLQFMFYHVTGALPQLKNGRLRAIALAAPTRDPQLPDLPTFAEAGMPNFDVTAWIGLMAPAGTPPEIIALINSQCAALLALPQVQQRYRELGAEAVGGTSAAFGERIRAESAKWGALIKQANIRLD